MKATGSFHAKYEHPTYNINGKDNIALFEHR